MISFQGVTKKYSKEIGLVTQMALNDLSFFVKKGETLGLVGANGAGKSTSIKLLMDFIRPDKGTIQLFDGSPAIARVRKNIGYLPEIVNFPANLSVHDLLGFTGTTCEISRDKLKKRSQELLTLVGLWEVRKSPLRTYSKGMQQRASFAIALINDPELLILDEPMSGLDPMGRKKIIDLIAELKQAGKTILFCSHILEDVDRLVDNILLLDKGKKLFLGTPGELVAQEGCHTLAEAFVTRIEREGANV